MMQLSRTAKISVRILILAGMVMAGAAGCDTISGFSLNSFGQIKSVQLFDEPDFTVAFSVDNPSGNVSKVNWVFGDGNGFVEGPAGRTTISYRYLSTGNFQVTAFVFDNQGKVTQLNGSANVTPTGNGPDVALPTDLPGQIANANPLDGAQNVNVATKLTWTAGARAASHDIYLGLDQAAVSSANHASAGIFRSNQIGTQFDPAGLTQNTSYFWRIDEVNALGVTKGTVRTFKTAEAPAKAKTPVPGNGSTNARVDQALNWTAGDRTTSHDVYFGKTALEVDTATKETPDIFQKNQTGTSFDPEDETATLPGELLGATQYFWRVDEVGAGGTTKGDTWMFTTRPPPPQIDNPGFSPADGAMDVAIDDVLSWNAPSTVESYDVYLGLDIVDVTGADRNSPEFKGNQTAKLFDPPTLFSNVDYFWRIDTRGPGGTTPGMVFTFKTAAPPGAVALVAPANNATNINVQPTLSWTAGGGMTDSFDIYLSTNQAAVTSGAASAFKQNQAVGITTFEPGMTTPLTADTQFFWRIDAIGPGGKTPGPIWKFRTAVLPGKATSPVPLSGTTSADPAQNLSWTAGSNTMTHDVYFGTSQSAVQNATHNAAEFKGNQPGTNFMPVGGLNANTQYFWRIDEVGDGGTKTGDLWNFKTGPGKALNPQPINGAGSVAVATNLMWTAGIGTSTHNVYFISDTDNTALPMDQRIDVANTTSPPFRGNQPGTSFDPPGDMLFNTTYLWRIDEVASDGSITKGTIWNFVTTSGTKATGPNPAHLATEIALDSLLQWTAGQNANMHRVFFGTDLALVTSAVDGSAEDMGDFSVTFFDPVLVANTTYFWRIDELPTGGGSPIAGDVWRFTTVTPPAQVSGQNPTSGSTGVSANPMLTWSSAARATTYDVYFISQADNTALPAGERIDVATSANIPPFVGNQASTSKSLSGLTANTTYLWRVDSKNDAGVTQGLVFSFTTAP